MNVLNILLGLLLLNTPPLSFQWHLQLLKKDNSLHQVTDQNIIYMEKGEGFSYQFIPQKGCYIRIFHISTENELLLLFSKDPGELEEGKKYPDPLQWFRLDAAAREEIVFIIVSPGPLKKISGLYEKYEKAKSRGEEKKTFSLKKETIDELYKLTDSLSKDAELIRKPVTITGVLKGEKGVEVMQVQGSFFARLIKIREKD